MRRNKDLCVKIARDVLLQLKKGRYDPSPGTYVEVNLGDLFEDLDGNIIDTNDPFEVNDPDDDNDLDEKVVARSDDSFKKLFKERKEITCTVCALGAAFVSLININNRCSNGDVINIAIEDMFDRLEKVFGQHNIGLMETAFEIEPMRFAMGLSPVDIEAAIEYGEQYEDDEERLRMIMRNVIRNKGDFVLPQKIVKRVEMELSGKRQRIIPYDLYY